MNGTLFSLLFRDIATLYLDPDYLFIAYPSSLKDCELLEGRSLLISIRTGCIPQ
jgi:hypothetical protein